LAVDHQCEVVTTAPRQRKVSEEIEMSGADGLLTDGEAYERLTGYWSRLVGGAFLDRLNLPKRLRWLGGRLTFKGCSRGLGERSGMLRAAPAIMSAIVLAGPVICLPESTRAQSATEKQAQCELSAIRNTRSAVAIQSIHSACNWLAINEGSLLNESLRGYYLCLVQNLSGAQDDGAAGAIVSACRASHPR
jgi:hypothetical protein